jgi:predicted enzyme related to lactoylglutathione lyase
LSVHAAQRAASASVAIAPQYSTTHVYVAPADFDAFVNSFIATFGGTASKRIVTNVLPVPSSTAAQYVRTPAGALSVFAFQTPIPYPFGEERYGFLVTDIDAAVNAARAAGAAVVVAPFQDPIGKDAVIEWPGGAKTQLYWHFTPPSSPALETIPDCRVYVSPDRAADFIHAYVTFSGGSIVKDDPRADAGEIGRPSETFRRVELSSQFGNVVVLVTDGHLPYPFGRETTGYRVADLDATLAKAKAAGAKILSPPYVTADRHTAVVEFPGGYIAEIHSVSAREAKD